MQMLPNVEPVSQYFDEFDFVLDSMDSALSGPSMTKSLNRYNTTNNHITCHDSLSMYMYAVK
jgi:hypothetical protein